MAKKTPKKKEAPLPEFIEKVELKHSFSDAEKGKILDDLSRKHEEKELVTAQAKSSAKGWKTQIDKIQLGINELSQKGRDGYEMRRTDVRIVLDRKRKKKKLYRVDNGQFIEEQDMTEFDFERLPLTIPDKPKAPKPGEGLTNVGEEVEKAQQAEENSAEENSASPE